MFKQCTVPNGETIAKGDAVCVTDFDTTNNRPTIKRATRENLATSKTVFGVAEHNAVFEDGAVGGSVFVIVAGEVTENAITSLGAGKSNIVAPDILNATEANQCRLIRIERPDGSEYVVGTCDENGNLVVQPRASRETSALHVFNVRSYGAIPDWTPMNPSPTDNLPFFQAALTAMAASGNRGAKLVADGHFFLSDTLVLTQTIVLEGSGQNEPPPFFESSRSTPGTMLVFPKFPKNVTGIRIRGASGLDNPTRTYDNPFPPSAEKTILRNLTIFSTGDIPPDAIECSDEQGDCNPEEGCIHGIYASTVVRLENITVENFTHDGIHIVGGECCKPLFSKNGKIISDCDPALDVDCQPLLDNLGNPVRACDGNAAGSYVENCIVGGCGRDGFHFRGGDAATCVINCCSAVVNRRYGFFDKTRVNTYIGCHAEGNTVEYHTEGSLPAPASGYNSSTFVGCYAEGNGDRCEFYGDVTIVGGAIGDTNVKKDSTGFILEHGVASRALFAYQNDSGPVITRIELGQQEGADPLPPAPAHVHGGVLNFSLPALADYNLLRYDETFGWWGLDNSSPSGRTSFRFPTTIANPRRTAPLFSQGIFYGSPSALGDPGASKALTSHVGGTAAPTPLSTGGTWEVGDVVWNSAPVPNGPIGWICTTAGTEDARVADATGIVDAIDGSKLMLDLLPANLAKWQYITILGVEGVYQIVNDPGHPAPDAELTVRITPAAPVGASGGIDFSRTNFATFGVVDSPSKSYAVDTPLTLADRYVTVTVTGMTITLPRSPVDGQTHSIKSRANVTSKVDSTDGILIDGALTATVGPLENRNFRYSAAIKEWEIR